MYITAPMDENVVASETYYFTPKNCFVLNELSQEGIIIFILFVIYNSYYMMLIVFLIFVLI